MKYVKKVSKYSVSIGVGAILATGLGGCGDDNSTQEQTQQPKKDEKQPAFVILEEVKEGKYKVAEEFPAKETRIIVKKLDGTEKVLTQQELDEMIKKEAAKIDEGTSNLTKPEGAQVAQQNGGMSMGEAILASAAGAVLGSWIGSKLFSNPNYQETRRAGYKSPAVYNKSMNSFRNSSPISKGSSTSTTKKSGFFGNKSGSSSRSSSKTFGG